MSKKVSMPTPDQIYLALKKSFSGLKKAESIQDKSVKSNSERLEILYSRWKIEDVKLDEPITMRVPRHFLLSIVSLLLLFSAASVLIDKISPVYTDNIRQLICDNLSRLTFLVVIWAMSLAGSQLYSSAKDASVLSPIRVLYAYQSEVNLPKKKKTLKYRINVLFLFITIASLFFLGYVWTMILAVVIGFIVLALWGASFQKLNKETISAFEKI